MAVEFGEPGRELEEAALLAFVLEVGLGASVDLDGGEGHVGQELVEEALGVVSGCAATGLCAGPLGHGGGELLDGGASVSGGQGVELDDLARGVGLGLRPLGSRLAGVLCVAEWGRGDGTLVESLLRMRVLLQTPLSSQHGGDLGLAPCRVVGAHFAHRLHQRWRPCGPAVGAS